MNPAIAANRTADAVLSEAVDPLDSLLRQIINGYFVLTDGNGAVSKWSEPAELLFGRPAENVLRLGFFDTLITGPLPPAGEAWRDFLAAGDAPRAPGSVQLTGLRGDGGQFALEAVFVPVKLDEGFDFSLFLEDLSVELPLNLMLPRMRQQHPVVVHALMNALAPDVQPWHGWRTAGTLVIFTPLEATPWVEAELARREAERAAADAETEERISHTDPGIQGEFRDLDDAAAVVARLLSAVERIDELERVASGLPAQLDELRRSLPSELAVVASHVTGLREAVARADATAGEVTALRDTLARHERLTAELRESNERLTAELRERAARHEQATAELRESTVRHDDVAALRDALAHHEATAGQISVLQERLDNLAGREELLSLATQEEVSALSERVEAATALGTRVDELRGALDAGLARLDTVTDAAASADEERAAALRAEIGDVRDAMHATALGVEQLRDELAAARAADEERAAALRAELAAVRAADEERLTSVWSELADARTADDERIADLRSEIAALRARDDERLTALRAELSATRLADDERIVALQAQLAVALKDVDELREGLTSAGQAAVIARREAEQARRAAQQDGSTERVTEVFQQILGLAAQRAQPVRRAAPAVAKPAAPPKRAPRHGFDDAVQPMAVLSLDGKFKELNPAFAKLVGYKEHEFTKAAWPSPHDRKDYQDQLDHLRKLSCGELREIEISSTYMHGQGLMVPVVGTLTVHAGENGAPESLLLVAEDRHTT